MVFLGRNPAAILKGVPRYVQPLPPSHCRLRFLPVRVATPGNRHGAAAVLLSVMADHFDANPVAVTEANPYRHVFAALAKYENSPFVR
jgi:hypothetical protein